MILDNVRSTYISDTEDFIKMYPSLRKEILYESFIDFKDEFDEEWGRETTEDDLANKDFAKLVIDTWIRSYRLCDFLDGFLGDIKGEYDFITVDYDELGDGAHLYFYNLVFECEEDALVLAARMYKKYGFSEEEIKGKAVELELEDG